MARTPMWRRYDRFWGSDLRADVDAELDFHVRELTERLVRVSGATVTLFKTGIMSDRVSSSTGRSLSGGQWRERCQRGSPTAPRVARTLRHPRPPQSKPKSGGKAATTKAAQTQ